MKTSYVKKIIMCVHAVSLDVLHSVPQRVLYVHTVLVIIHPCDGFIKYCCTGEVCGIIVGDNLILLIRYNVHGISLDFVHLCSKLVKCHPIHQRATWGGLCVQSRQTR